MPTKILIFSVMRLAITMLSTRVRWLELFGTTGVLIGSTSASPNTNKTSISKNTFIDGGANAEGYGLLSAQQGKSITHEIVIAGNTFNGSDTNTSGAGLAVLDTSKGVISGNSFKAGAMTWITLASGDPADGGLDATVKGWAIVSNSFLRIDGVC
jgi:hypothetical protein